MLQITSKGYVSFDSPYYGDTMVAGVFQQLFNQAIVAPFWGNLAFIVVSKMKSFYLCSTERKFGFRVDQQLISVGLARLQIIKLA